MLIDRYVKHGNVVRIYESRLIVQVAGLGNGVVTDKSVRSRRQRARVLANATRRRAIFRSVISGLAVNEPIKYHGRP